jgi:hypothetical protein
LEAFAYRTQTAFHVLFRNGVFPFQSFESREIRVGGIQRAIMFDCKGGEMGIGNQISRSFPTLKHLLENRPVLVCGLDNANAGLIKPALHAFSGFFKSKRPLMQSGIRANANDRAQNGPTQTN